MDDWVSSIRRRSHDPASANRWLDFAAAGQTRLSARFICRCRTCRTGARRRAWDRASAQDYAGLRLRLAAGAPRPRDTSAMSAQPDASSLPTPRIKSLPALCMATFRHFYRPLWRAMMQWIDADGMRMSAAMSFYGILSLAPLLVLLVAVLGWWLDRSFIEASLEGIRGRRSHPLHSVCHRRRLAAALQRL